MDAGRVLRAARRGGSVRAGPAEGASRRPGELPLFDGDERRRVRSAPDARVRRVAHAPHVLLENLAIKASGVHALRDLLATDRHRPGVDHARDRLRRGGGRRPVPARRRQRREGDRRGVRPHRARARIDVKSFCAAPIHALVVAAALIEAGDRATGSSWSPAARSGKLGMKFEGALAAGLPDPRGRARRDGDPARARRRVERSRRCGPTPSAACRSVPGCAPQAQLDALVGDAARRARRRRSPTSARTPRRSTTPRSPSRRAAATSPTGTTGCSRGSACVRGELDTDDIPAFARAHGMPGFAPTQGHIASAVPWLPHALARMRARRAAPNDVDREGLAVPRAADAPVGRRVRRRWRR